MLKHLLISMMVLGSAVVMVTMSACSGGSSSSDEIQQQQARDSKALEDLYSGVQGTWSGTVTNAATGLASFEGELKLYVYYIQDGSNADGTPRLRPTLRGRFQPNDFVTETDVMMLVGTYDRSGRIVMTAQTGQDTSLRLLSVRGTVANGKMSAELGREGGTWGTFVGVRTSTTSSAPTAGEQTEYRERYLRIYGPVEGRYQGRMKSVNGNDYGVEIAIVIIEQPTVGGSRPVLSAQYRRLDVPAGTLEWSLNVDYHSQTGEILMRESSSSGSTVPGGMILSVSGTLSTVAGQKQLDVTVRNRAAVLGSLSAVRSGGGATTPGLPII